MDEKYIIEQYRDKNKSMPELANEFQTYPNKIRRILLKNKIEIKDRSIAQKIALTTGRSTHPTEGKERNAETKLKISKKTSEAWHKKTDAQKKAIKKKLSKEFKKRDPEKLQEMQKKAAIAIAKSGKTGSKVEIFLYEKLIEAGYNVLFHKKGIIENTNLEPDLIIPDLNVVIEVDGPSHFYPIWGQEKLDKKIAADFEKNGLFLKHGFHILRVKHICKTFTSAKKRYLIENILKEIKKINGKPNIIEIEL